jgi:hypothetical protein
MVFEFSLVLIYRNYMTVYLGNISMTFLIESLLLGYRLFLNWYPCVLGSDAPKIQSLFTVTK